jgi:hypothetical protein
LQCRLKEKTESALALCAIRLVGGGRPPEAIISTRGDGIGLNSRQSSLLTKDAFTIERGKDAFAAEKPQNKMLAKIKSAVKHSTILDGRNNALPG